MNVFKYKFKKCMEKAFLNQKNFHLHKIKFNFLNPLMEIYI
jgi:hypothetical protein